MNCRWTLMRSLLIAVWIGTVPVGVGQEDPAGLIADAESPTLHAERQDDRLIVTAQHLHGEPVRALGLIRDHSMDITAEVREALERQEAQVESRPGGFTLDFGPARNENPEPGAGVFRWLGK